MLNHHPISLIQTIKKRGPDQEQDCQPRPKKPKITAQSSAASTDGSSAGSNADTAGATDEEMNSTEQPPPTVAKLRATGTPWVSKHLGLCRYCNADAFAWCEGVCRDFFDDGGNESDDDTFLCDNHAFPAPVCNCTFDRFPDTVQPPFQGTFKHTGEACSERHTLCLACFQTFAG